MVAGIVPCDLHDKKRGILIDRLHAIEQKKERKALGEIEILNFILKKGVYK